MSTHSIIQQQNGDIVLAGREFVKAIYNYPGAGGTNKTFRIRETIPINPGLGYLFQWINPLTINYDNWKPLGLAFEFVPKWIPASTATGETTGDVFWYYEHDPGDPAPSSGAKIKNSHDYVAGHLYDHLVYTVDCHPKHRVKEALVVRHTDVTNVSELRLMDLGRMFLATEHLPASVDNAAAVNLLGEIWISYKILLMKRQAPERGLFLRMANFACGIVGLTANTMMGNPLYGPGTGISTHEDSYTLPITLSYSANRLQMKFPEWITEGSYVIIYNCNATAITWGGGNAVSNCANLNDVYGGAINQTYAHDGGIAMGVFPIYITGPGAVYEIYCTLLTIGGSGASLKIQEIGAVVGPTDPAQWKTLWA